MAKSSRPAKTAKNKSTVRNSRTTVSGPAEPDASGTGDSVAEKAAGTQDLASAFPFNPNKLAEYDPDAALAPPEGASVKPADPIVGASTVSEMNGSDKVGSGSPNLGQNPTVGPLVALWRESRKTGKLPAAAALESARELVGWRHIEIDRSTGAVRLAKDGMRLDLGGIAKGYILQEALRLMRMKGQGRVLIESGGDIVVGSGPPGLPGWRISAPGADDVFRQRASQLTNAALATSGPGEQFVDIDGTRYSHIVDPRTGLGATTHVTARVIARDAATADALATALTIIGPQGAKAILDKFPGVLISLSVAAPK